MKTCLSCAILLLALSAAAQPTLPVRVDLQAPQREFKTRWAAGSTPTLGVDVYNAGAAYTNLTGWTGQLYVAVTATAGVFVSSSSHSSNRVLFPFGASQCATVGTFAAYVILGNGTNNYQWGEGSFTWTDSPALLGAGPISLAVPFNWDNYTFTGTAPAFPAYFTNPIAGEVTGDPTNTVIAAGVVTTGKLSAEVRGMLIEPDRVSTGDLTPQVRGMLATGVQAHAMASAAYSPTNPPPETGIDTNSASWTGLVAQVEAASATGATAYARIAELSPQPGVLEKLTVQAPSGTTNYTASFAPGSTYFSIGYMRSVTNFPTNGIPVNDEVYFISGALWATWRWNGAAWVHVSGPSVTDIGDVVGMYNNKGTNNVVWVGRNWVGGSGIPLGIALTWWDLYYAWANSIEARYGTAANSSKLGGYLPTDFVLAAALTNSYIRLVAQPSARTNSGANGQAFLTNGWFGAYQANGWGTGTNWGAVELDGWPP